MPGLFACLCRFDFFHISLYNLSVKVDSILTVG